MKTIIPDGSQLMVSPLELHEAPWNPRRERNKEALDALTASVRDVGILQPMVVRDASDGGLEVVCGHRRLAAAVAAGLEQIPVVIRHIDDQGAYNLAVTENLQREDLTAVDEAEAYKALLGGGMTVDEVAARAGRSKSHVYLRLKLLELPEAATEAVRDGRMTEAIAGLIGRIPGAQQREEATEKVLAGARIVQIHDEDARRDVFEPMSYQAARKLLVDGYMLTLASAPFDVNDQNLVPAAGSCAACHHRTGNQKDLFGDVVAEGGADVCTYPACYESKREAHADAVCAETGIKRLKIVEMDKTFYSGSANLAYNAKWVDADKPAEYGATGKKPLRKALGDAAPQEFVAIDGTGAVRHLYRKKDVETALKAMKPEKNDRSAENLKSETKLREQRALHEARVDAVAQAIRRVVEGPKFTASAGLLRAIAFRAWSFMQEREPLRRRGLDCEVSEAHADKIMASWLDRASPNECLALLIETTLDQDVRELVAGRRKQDIDLASLFRIDPKKIMAGATTTDPAAPTIEPVATPAPKKPTPKKKVTKKAVKKTAKKARSKK